MRQRKSDLEFAVTGLVLAQPLLEHVHGLAYAPDGKALFVPGHTGLAVFRDASWSEVDGPIHDFAGFSMAEGAMYASGHPPAGSPLPDPLGLVKSTDGGRTWRHLALGGEADFHWVAAGYRSATVYVLSTQANSAMPRPGLHWTRNEGRTWQRAAQRGLDAGLQVYGLAAHPHEAGTLAIATPRGLYLSTDAGDTFRRVSAGLAVTAVTFDYDGKHVLYASAVRRQLLTAPLAGGKHRVTRLPKIGFDYATHIAQNPADPGTLAVATDRRHVFVTGNAGKDWRQIARDGDLP